MKPRFSLTYLLVSFTVIAIAFGILSLPTTEQQYVLAVYLTAGLLYLTFAPGAWSSSRLLNVASAIFFLLISLLVVGLMVAVIRAWR